MRPLSTAGPLQAAVRQDEAQEQARRIQEETMKMVGDNTGANIMQSFLREEKLRFLLIIFHHKV